jgi:hypothetical protein
MRPILYLSCCNGWMAPPRIWSMTESTFERAEKLLADPLWRLNNLYWIIDKSGNKTLFKLNWAQEQLYRDLWYCNLILKARQLGISTFVCLLFLDRCSSIVTSMQGSYVTPEKTPNRCSSGSNSLMTAYPSS